jgi:hypothetical protein
MVVVMGWRTKVRSGLSQRWQTSRPFDTKLLMLLIRHSWILAGLMLAVAPGSAFACSPALDALEQAPKKAAAKGYFVKARVIRGYDAKKKLPEMLEIEKIFVGADIPRFVTLYRDEGFFAARAQGLGDTCSVEFSAAQPAARLYILYPVASGKMDVFELDWLFSVSVYGQGLETMLAEAKRNGRLRGRPLPEDF